MDFPRQLYNRDQVRELDRIAIEEYSISGFMLMQRAAKASYDAMLNEYPSAQNIVVVCGTGNNGGDGYLFAKLALRDGFSVSIIQLGNTQSIAGDALLAKKTFELCINSHYALEQQKRVFIQKVGGVLYGIQNLDKLKEADIIIDAIFGTGLDRKIEGDWATTITCINNSSAKVISIDIPSGLDANTGAILACCVQADLSITYIGLKKGLFTGQARNYRGKLLFDDLAIPNDVYSKIESDVDTYLIDTQDVQRNLKPRLKCSHKGDAGHVLLIGGNQGMSGAIRLAGEAVLRTGAGLVSIATHPAHADWLNLSRPELMVHAVENTSALDTLITRADVIAIGPGLGQTEWGQALFDAVLQSEKPIILDADALNLLSKTHSTPNDNWVLTPHPAEAARLLSTTSNEIEQDRYQSILNITQKWGGVIALKGAGSLISDGNTTWVCNAGNPGMASGGMGDVLMGIIAALIAQGLSLSKATTVGVTVHAMAADFAAEAGERGLIASDLFPFIRKLVNNPAHE